MKNLMKKMLLRSLPMHQYLLVEIALLKEKVERAEKIEKEEKEVCISSNVKMDSAAVKPTESVGRMKTAQRTHTQVTPRNMSAILLMPRPSSTMRSQISNTISCALERKMPPNSPSQ